MMLGLLVAISAVACFESSSYTDAVSITNVTVPDRSASYIMLWHRPDDPTWVNRIEFRCEYSISPAPATPPTITWLMGSFTNAARQVIYKWSSSGEVYVHPRFAGGVSVPSRTHPTLVLTDIDAYVWGRFWCRVTNEEQPGELGTDEESLLFYYNTGAYNPPRGSGYSFVEVDKTPVRVKTGGTARLHCEGMGGPQAAIAWFKGPRCTQDGNCNLYEMVINKTAVGHWSSDPGAVNVSPKYAGRASVGKLDSYMGLTFPDMLSLDLTITDIRPTDVGRYWCTNDWPLSTHNDLHNRDSQSVVVLLDDEAPSCDGKADGMYQDPGDCSRYYTCSGGWLYGPVPCISGLFFNEALQVCDWPNNVVCA